jgi:arylsulfate sulfotransferase
LWELGTDGSLRLTSGDWTSHQHAVELLGDDELMVYDNGNGRTPPYSRAVIYKIDAAAGTAEQVWEHRDTTDDGRPMYTPFLGDVDRLANGDILITHGGASTADGKLYGRIVEVDPDSDDVVWDLTVGETSGLWTLYRAERYDSLYGAAFASIGR